MEFVKQSHFEDGYFGAVVDRIGPDPSDLPNVDLSVGDDVAPRRSEVSAHPGADAVDRLSDINWHLVDIAEDIAADFVGELANGSADEKEDRSPPATPLRWRSRFLFALQERLEDVSCNMPYDRHADAITTDVIGLVIAFRQHVIIT